jgi:hypothetical protein
MTARLRVAIATAGRFHVLDLARELNALGYAVDFYSYVPKTRALRFGLPRLPSIVGRSPSGSGTGAVRAGSAVIREWLLYKSLNLAVVTRLRLATFFIACPVFTLKLRALPRTVRSRHMA